MSRVGIIANPASGKDIRRLVSHATVISNYEKMGIVRRVILGLDSTGVEEILIMPDYYGLGIKALEALNHHILSSKITILDFEVLKEYDAKEGERMMKVLLVAAQRDMIQGYVDALAGAGMRFQPRLEGVHDAPCGVSGKIGRKGDVFDGVGSVHVAILCENCGATIVSRTVQNAF